MQLIGNAMLIEYTKINKKGITRMQLLITFGLKDSICSLGHVTGKCVWYRQDQRGNFFRYIEPIKKWVEPIARRKEDEVYAALGCVVFC
jgi:hypothetical protein